MTEPAAGRLQAGLGLSPLLARLLAARGWSEPGAVEAFLEPSLDHIHAPWLMRGMDAAVDRIRAAAGQGEHIRILGDYDADGTLATVILLQALRDLGARVSYRLPDRLNEGYGLQVAAIEEAHRDGVRLAITVDTGIRELPALERAVALGLEVIITDHHLPAAKLPPAFAILNPRQPGCDYPNRDLCGAGVAFKLVQALLQPKAGPWPARLRSYLKLVALATIADAVPLLGENRAMARLGLEALAHPVNPGLQALLATARKPGATKLSGADVSFRVAPRLNAAGRMGKADQVVELFFASATEAPARARTLDALNLDRQRLCARIQTEIAAHPQELAGPVAVLAGEGWHRGVLGIVASRLLATERKPILVASIEPRPHGGWQAHGSGRAPAGVHLLQMLEACSPLFDRFGGHAQAVGFSLPAERIPELRQRLWALAPAIPADAPAAAGALEVSLAQLTLAFARELQRLEPWGEGNPEPQFQVRGARLLAAPQPLRERHARFLLEQDGARQEAIAWNLWREGRYQTTPGCPDFDRLQPNTRLDLVFRLEHTSHPRYGERLQLILSQFLVMSDPVGAPQR